MMGQKCKGHMLVQCHNRERLRSEGGRVHCVGDMRFWKGWVGSSGLRSLLARGCALARWFLLLGASALSSSALRVGWRG